MVVEGHGTAIGELRENVHQLGVVVEGLRGEIHQVAEGVINLDEKLDRFGQEIGGKFQAVEALIRVFMARWIVASGFWKERRDRCNASSVRLRRSSAAKEGCVLSAVR